MGASRQIKCMRIVQLAYQCDIIKRFECVWAVELCIASGRRTAGEIEEGDVRNKPEVEIASGRTGKKTARETRYICELH
jgi:hypothetical protein